MHGMKTPLSTPQYWHVTNDCAGTWRKQLSCCVGSEFEQLY